MADLINQALEVLRLVGHSAGGISSRVNGGGAVRPPRWPGRRGRSALKPPPPFWTARAAGRPPGCAPLPPGMRLVAAYRSMSPRNGGKFHPQFNAA